MKIEILNTNINSPQLDYSAKMQTIASVKSGKVTKITLKCQE